MCLYRSFRDALYILQKEAGTLADPAAEETTLATTPTMDVDDTIPAPMIWLTKEDEFEGEKQPGKRRRRKKSTAPTAASLAELAAESVRMPYSKWTANEQGRQYLAFAGHSKGHVFEREEGLDGKVHWQFFDLSSEEGKEAFEARIDEGSEGGNQAMMTEIKEYVEASIAAGEDDEEEIDPDTAAAQLETCLVMAGRANAATEGYCQVCATECQFRLPENERLFTMARVSE